jgi:hypothetical protein
VPLGGEFGGNKTDCGECQANVETRAGVRVDDPLKTGIADSMPMCAALAVFPGPTKDCTDGFFVGIKRKWQMVKGGG